MTREGLHRNTFSLQLDRAAEHRGDPAWFAAVEHAPTTRFLVLDGDGRVLATPTRDAPLWLDSVARWRLAPAVAASLLGVAAGAAWCVLPLPGAAGELLPAAVPLGLRAAGSLFAAFDAGLAAYACGLVQWQRATHYCRSCGARLRLDEAGHRARCDACGREHFPRTDPAVIMLVERDGACLLGRQAAWQAGRYSTLAGFVEPGESLEDAVRREVAEETGVRIGACSYHSSQPWPFPASLMLGFVAKADSHDIVLRDGELEDARWFTPGGLVDAVRGGEISLSPPLSISHRLITDWLRERGGVDLAALQC